MESITFVGWPLGPLTRTVLYALAHSALISGGIFVPPPHRARYKHFRNPNSQPLSQQGSPRNSLPQTERDKRPASRTLPLLSMQQSSCSPVDPPGFQELYILLNSFAAAGYYRALGGDGWETTCRMSSTIRRINRWNSIACHRYKLWSTHTKTHPQLKTCFFVPFLDKLQNEEK